MEIPDTQRLTFALIGESDTQLLFDLDQDPEVMRFINGGKPTSMEDIKNKMLPRLTSYTHPEKGWGMWKVTVKDSNAFIGWILVRPMDYFSESPQWKNLELGWRFKQSSWGKGYATEAAQQIMDSLFTEQEIDSVCAIADVDNHASTNIMKKLGMKYVKTYLHHDPLFTEEVVYYLREK